MIADIRAGIGRLRLDVAEFDGRSTDAAIDVLITRDERLLAPGCAGVLAEMRIHLLIVLFLQQRSKCLQLLLRRRPRRHEHRDAGDDCDHGSRRDDRDASRLFAFSFPFPLSAVRFSIFYHVSPARSMTQKRRHPGTFSQLVAECQRIDEMQVQSRDDFIHDIILFLLQIFLGIMGVRASR